MNHSIQNGHIRAEWRDSDGAFRLINVATNHVFIPAGRLSQPGGEGAIVDITWPRLGPGKALEITGAQGVSNRIVLFPGVPFALFQSVLQCSGQEEATVQSVRLLGAQVELQKPARELKVLGTAGLKLPDEHAGSYVFLAVADPDTRNSVVGAWLTHDRGSGVVFSELEGEHVRLTAQIDYGRLLVKPGQSEASEIFALGWFDDGRLGLEQWADLVARQYDITLRPQPDGYCTWYSDPFGGASDEKHLAELGKFAARELKPYGFDFVQIDDKWQEGRERNGPAKVFCRHNAKGPYRHGMKPPADHVKSLGLTPGIWFIPFAGDRQDPFFADKQHFFVKDPDGNPYFAEWGGTAMDMTHPEARRYLADMVRLLSHEWGYTYFKMDGLWMGTATRILYVNNGYKPDDLGAQSLYDEVSTQIEAYRSGLKLVREAAGEDVFFLGCNVSQNMRSFGASFGLVDAMRIGPDNGPDWNSLTQGPWHGSNRYFLHGRIWHNDPDPLYVRESIPLEQAQLICSWIAVTGQLNVSSDWLPSLPEERLDLLKRTLPNHALKPRPVDFFESDLPRIWLLTDEKDETRRDVVGLFNWDAERPVVIEETVERIGLPRADTYVGFEYWTNQFVPRFKQSLSVKIPPSTCRVLATRPAVDHPQVISTSRHITQGVVDLVSECWDEKELMLSGISRVVSGDPYELRIVVPQDSWRAEEATSLCASGEGTADIVQKGAGIRVTLRCLETGEVAWHVRFAPRPM